MYWDSTGDWRLTYYSELASRNKDSLSVIEKAELELDNLEKEITISILNGNLIHTFLDIGCGVGRQLIEFSERFKNTYFWGVDISSYQIELLNSIIQKRRIKNVFGICADVGTIYWINEKFDMISLYNNSFGCMNEMQQVKCLDFIESHLKIGGFLLISSFNRIDMIEEAYKEWGLNPVSIDYTDGKVDLGVYISNWKTQDTFLPFFEKHHTICLKDSVQAGLGTIYIFNRN